MVRLLIGAISIFSLLTACNQNISPTLNSAVYRNQIPSMNIIDGQVITELQTKAAHSIVAVELLDKNRNILTYCTGVLIGPQTVLTAAHCLSQNVVRDVNGFNVIFQTQTKSVSVLNRRHGFKFQIHSSYNTEKKTWILSGNKYLDLNLHPELNNDPSLARTSYLDSDHDLAVLVFKGTVPRGYAPVSIDTDDKADYRGQTVYIYGFGRAYDYLDANGEVDTTGQLRRGTAVIDSDFFAHADRYFLTKDSQNKLCQGDSGGPQFYNENGQLKIIGINSAVASEEDSIKIDKSIIAGNLISCRGRSQVAKVAPAAEWIKAASKQMVTEMIEVLK